MQSLGVPNSSLEQHLGLMPQFKSISSEVRKMPEIPPEGLISDLLSESNFEDIAVPNNLNVRENLKNMLIHMQ
jgi:hypothetical protein